MLPLPPATLQGFANAIVTPVGDGRDLPCGIFGADGRFAPASRTALSGQRFTGTPVLPHADTVQDLPGRYLYGGLARVHFGHFLVETITRLWALAHLDTPPDAVLFLPMPGRVLRRSLENRLRPLVSAIIGDVPYRQVDTPLRVQELILPTQGVGHLRLSTGTPEYRAFTRTRLEARFAPEGPERLYVSRSRLEGEEKRFDREPEVEEAMADADYDIFHPQEHPLDIQIACYRAARVIVGADSSAFHLAALVMAPGTRVGLIKRRHRNAVFRAIRRQVEAFSQVDLVAFDPLLPQKKSAAFAPVDLPALLASLKTEGFL
ncbi:glycosyltransferase family 61 protein [Marimonas lutisalis]|uniref:glycosyltransferase family 61 protein n=1 Tax=Marimonas lutisalis TaxID=2545756 RepID=UPI001375EC05|nr:glycosyltransferase 61 family protein [Marimonas lutisalis]